MLDGPTAEDEWMVGGSHSDLEDLYASPPSDEQGSLEKDLTRAAGKRRASSDLMSPMIKRPGSNAHREPLFRPVSRHELSPDVDIPLPATIPQIPPRPRRFR
jgi:hypothetical protein